MQNKLFSPLLGKKVQICVGKPGIELKGVGNGEGWLKGNSQILRSVWPGWKAAVKTKDVHGRERGHRVPEGTKPPLRPLS